MPDVQDHPDGSRKLSINLTPEQSRLLGGDALSMMNDLQLAYEALAELRAGRWDQTVESPHDEGNPGARQRQRMDETIYNLERHAVPMLEGIRTAALRAYRQQGATFGDLATAMGIAARSTAYSKWKTLTAGEPDRWERWARTGTHPYA